MTKLIELLARLWNLILRVTWEPFWLLAPSWLNFFFLELMVFLAPEGEGP